MTHIYSDIPWFLAHTINEKPGPRLISLCREMALRQQTLITNTEKCMAVFEYGGEAKDLEPGDHFPVEEHLLTFNSAQNVVETVFSKVIKARIAPMPLTSGGGYLQRHRARQLGKALEGVMDDNDVDSIEEDVVMDALTTDHGGGALMVTEDGREVKIQHVPIEDVWFDAAEVRHREPRNLYRVPRGGLDKFVAIELFAREGDEHPGLVGTAEQRKQALLNAAMKPESWRNTAGSDSAMRVDIFESWHLPSGDVECEDEDGDKPKRKHDGRHVVAVEGENGTLIDEPWEGPNFPVLLYVPRRRRRSVWGLSLMRDLIAPQRESERMSMKFQNAHQKMGVSGFMAPLGANFNVRDVETGTFGAGWVAEFEGPTPPIPLVIDPVPPAAYAYKEGIDRSMSEKKGVSTLSTSSQLPAGLQQASGKALQVFEDFEDVRLLPYHRARERFKVDLCWLIIHAAKRIVDRGKKYKARYRAKGQVERIDWADVIKDAEDCVLKVFPVSQLSKQPAAKFAQLTEMLNAGAINVEQFKRLFELPDLEAESELDTADTDIIDRNLDIMVIEGRYMSPEPFDDLSTLIARAGKFYNLCRQKEVPLDRMKLINDFIEDAKSLVDQIEAEKAAKEAAKLPPMPAGPPPMGPMGGAPPDGGMLVDPGLPPMGPPMPIAAEE